LSFVENAGGIGSQIAPSRITAGVDGSTGAQCGTEGPFGSPLAAMFFQYAIIIFEIV